MVGLGVGLTAIALRYLVSAYAKTVRDLRDEDADDDNDNAPKERQATQRYPSSSSSKTSSSYQGERAAASRATVGIDLGAMCSRLAVPVRDEASTVLRSAKVIENAEGSRVTPSVVSYASQPLGEKVFGELASRHRYSQPKSTFRWIKHLIGRTHDDPVAQRILALNRVEHRKMPNGDVQFLLEKGTPKYPIEILADFLGYLRACSESHTMLEVSHATISLPRSCLESDQRRKAFETAARNAGFSAVDFISDTEAALAARLFDLEHRPSSSSSSWLGGKSKAADTIMICDIGAGTKISVLDVASSRVLESKEDLFFGGLDLEEPLVTEIVREFAQEHNIDLLQDPYAEQRIREATERSKIELSSAFSTNINLPFISADAKGPKHLSMNVPRSKFENMISPTVDAAITLCNEVLQRSRQKGLNPQELLLTGALSKIPLISRRFRDLAETNGMAVSELSSHWPSDELIALGSAIRSHQSLNPTSSDSESTKRR